MLNPAPTVAYDTAEARADAAAAAEADEAAAVAAKAEAAVRKESVAQREAREAFLEAQRRTAKAELQRQQAEAAQETPPSLPDAARGDIESHGARLTGCSSSMLEHAGASCAYGAARTISTVLGR